MLQLINKVQQAVYKNTFIKTTKKNACLIVSVSGGQDSIFLLLTCYLLQSQLCIPRTNRCMHPYKNFRTRQTFVLHSFARRYKPPFQWLLVASKSAHAETKDAKQAFLQNTILQARPLTCFWCEAPSPSPSPSASPSPLPLASPSLYLLSCNHFWQKNSFYVTLHLSKSALVFCLPMLSFTPLNDSAYRHACTCVGLPRCEAKLRTKGKAKRGITEQKARAWRHLVTDRASTFYNSESCMYGHTQSDRVETTLFNLIRGAGHKGVASLQWEREYSSFSYNKFYPTLKQLQKETHF